MSSTRGSVLIMPSDIYVAGSTGESRVVAPQLHTSKHQSEADDEVVSAGESPDLPSAAHFLFEKGKI